MVERWKELELMNLRRWMGIKPIASHAGLASFPLKDCNGLKRDFFHRNTNADLGVIRQIFIEKDYCFDKLKRTAQLKDFYKINIEKNKIPFIIDAGANIGASAVYFSNEFPECEVCSFEPEAGNFFLLEKNVKNLDVKTFNEAIGIADGHVTVLDPGEGAWGYRTKPDQEGSTKVRGIGPFVQSKIDDGFLPFIAKIDIEGGEEGLFDHPNDWVDQFPVIIIELHDWLLPKANTSRSFLKCVAERNRDFVYIGENIFSISNDLL